MHTIPENKSIASFAELEFVIMEEQVNIPNLKFNSKRQRFLVCMKRILIEFKFKVIPSKFKDPCFQNYYI